MPSFLVPLALAAALAAAGTASPAAAARIWVSGHGVDQAGCGAPAAPCRSLQFAHDNIAGGGEIDILDPAGYGAITITKSVSIVNDGVGTAGVQSSSGDAITVNAGANAQVYLRGLNIDGVSHSGLDGVTFNSGDRLTIDHCVIRHFSEHGVLVQQTAGTSTLVVTDSVSSDNGGAGLRFLPLSGTASVSAEVNRLIATGDLDGVLISDSLAGTSVSVAMHDLDASANVVSGAQVDALNGANVVVSIDDSQFNLNIIDGLAVRNGAVAHLSRSRFNQNGFFGVENVTTGSGAAFSMGDNEARDNGMGNVSAAVTPQAPF